MFWFVYALLAAVFGGVAAVVGKKVLIHEHALEYGATQGLLTILLLIFVLPFIDLSYSWQTFVILYIISIAYTSGNLYFLKSIRHAEISSTIPLMNISPFFLLVIAYLFLGEEPNMVAIIGVLFLMVGAYVLQIGQSKKDLLAPFRALIHSKYSLYMVFAVFVFSFTATMEMAVIISGISFFTVFILLRLFTGLNYLIVEISRHGIWEVFKDAKTDGISIFLSLILSLAGFFFYFSALGAQGALVSLVIPVKRVATLISTMVGGRLFHEHRLGLKMGACAIMIIGVVLIAL